MSNKNPNSRFIGKILEKNLVRKSDGKAFTKHVVLVDNPDPDSEYNKGALIWVDNETGKKFLIKSLDLTGVGEQAASKGFINSIKIDLDNEYSVTELE